MSPFKEPKTNKSVLQSESEVLPCFEMNYKFLERHKSEKILWTRPRKWQAKVQPHKTKKRQRKKCQGRLPYIQKRKYCLKITRSRYLFAVSPGKSLKVLSTCLHYACSMKSLYFRKIKSKFFYWLIIFQRYHTDCLWHWINIVNEKIYHPFSLSH